MKQRINKEKTLELLESNDILNLGRLADEKRREFHPDGKSVTFVVDRNVNYTNICECGCNFCAFYKKKGESGSYVLDYEEIKQKTAELVSQNGTQLLLQGGLNSDLPLEYYLSLIGNLRKDFKDLTIHAFSPTETAFIAEKNNLTPEELIKKLIKCGLSSVPGGGAEILHDDIRKKISPNKISAQTWLDITESVHNSGLKTTATMVFGFGENYGHIIEHLFKIRDLQDKTGGFTAFIPWSVVPSGATAHDYLKILAVSRIVLDNIPNIQASWVTQGLDIAQIGLKFGANDFGGTMLEENVVKAAGVINRTNIEEVVKHIQKAGFKAAQRNTTYEILREF